MSLVWPILILIACAAVAIGAMLLVRRQAPEGSYFSDGDRASGVFGVIATGFSVLLGFVIFLAFTSYDETKQGSEVEALVLAQQFETAQFMPESVRDALGNSIVCYARYTVSQEWPRLKAGTQSGSRHRVKGKGIQSSKRTGDLIVTVDVQVPTSLSDAEREAVVALSAASTVSPRAHLEA